MTAVLDSQPRCSTILVYKVSLSMNYVHVHVGKKGKGRSGKGEAGRKGDTVGDRITETARELFLPRVNNSLCSVDPCPPSY